MAVVVVKKCARLRLSSHFLRDLNLNRAHTDNFTRHLGLGLFIVALEPTPAQDGPERAERGPPVEVARLARATQRPD